LRRLGGNGEAIDAYWPALELEPAPTSRFMTRRIRELVG
jgi:hypothetical protein